MDLDRTVGCKLKGTNGTFTLHGAPYPGDLPFDPTWYQTSRLQLDVQKDTDLKLELFPLHSPLLGESLLVSFPPLSYMLKFSGSSYLISGQSTKLSWVREQGRAARRALPPWPSSAGSGPPLCWCGRERGRGRAYTGVVESPWALFRLAGSPTTPRGPPVRCRAPTP